MEFLKSPLYLSDLEETVKSFAHWDRLEGKSILITGANGLIASCLVDCLILQNKLCGGKIKIYALCRSRERAEARFGQYLTSGELELIIQDVCEPLACEISFDYIIHAASNAHPVAFAMRPVETMKANLLGCMNLLDYCVKNRTEKFVFVSSAEIYGQNNSGEQGLKEDYCGYIDCSDPKAAYPESKRASEALCISYSREHEIPVVIARPWYIYGSTAIEESTKADMQFIRKASEKKDIVMKSAGTQLRSYVYMTDMALALLYILLFGESAKAYNIADKSSTYTIRQFAEILADISGVNIVFEDPGDVEKSGYSKTGNGVLDPSRLEALGWRARVSLREGLEKTLRILESME